MNEYKVGNLVVFGDGSSGLITEISEPPKGFNKDIEFKIEWSDGETNVVYASLLDMFVKHGKWTIHK
mgnify:FL=1